MPPKVYGFRSFADPGCSIDVGGPFRDNIRLFLSECAEIEDYNVEGMPTWVTFLVDENSGAVVPLYTVEEAVQLSNKPYCDYCRCTGWSHHFVSKRRYHLIIPVDSQWNRPLHGKIFDLQNHLLHGLIHCNGFGHLICLNGHEGGSTYVRGEEIMDLFDRICTTLRTREVTVEDSSRKRSMDLRLLYGVAYGQTWFGRWGYGFCHGSYGITSFKYVRALETLSSLSLDYIIQELRRTGRDREMKRTVSTYQKTTELEITTLQDLFCCMLELMARLPLPTYKTETLTLAAPPKPVTPLRSNSAQSNKKKSGKDRSFTAVAAELDSRWSVKRLELAAAVIVDKLKESGAAGGESKSRQEVRDMARLQIGDTGLLDFVLKSLGDCIVGDYVVRRTVNSSTRTLEFSLENLSKPGTLVPVEPSAILPITAPTTSERPATSVSMRRLQVWSDILYVYKTTLEEPMEGVLDAKQVVLDTKHLSKSWPFRDDDDAMLRFWCRVIPLLTSEVEELTRGIPVDELVVVPPHATMEDLRYAGELALRDTYCVLSKFEARWVEGEGSAEEVLFGLLESGSAVWLRGSGIDKKSELKYEGGMDIWTVDCCCGAKDDDGERMVACDVCEVWQHTRCSGIAEDDVAPQLFLCQRCATILMPPAKHFAPLIGAAGNEGDWCMEIGGQC